MIAAAACGGCASTGGATPTPPAAPTSAAAGGTTLVAIAPPSTPHPSLFQFLGITELTVVFSQEAFSVGGGPLGNADFEVTDTSGGPAPIVMAVDASNNPVVLLTLDRIISIKEWTTVIARVEDAMGNLIADLGNLGDDNEPDRVDVGFLPCDVDQNSAVEPLDLLRFRQYISFEYRTPC